ncbi:MAG TPA: hypothetical protein VGK59_18405 [Ohtaekwangia sp.]
MIVPQDSIFAGARGRFGNAYFKTIGNKTVMCKRPVRKKRKLTEREIKVRERLGKATAFAKNLSETDRKRYARMAKASGLPGAYHAAVRDFMKRDPVAAQ